METTVNEKNFKEEVLEAKIPVLLDFWAEWCGPCQMVAPTVEAIAKKYKGKLKVCKVNVDEASKTASDYKIMSIPTLAVFKKGKLVDKVIGVLPKAELEAMVEKYI